MWPPMAACEKRIYRQVPQLCYEKKLQNQAEWRHNLKRGAGALLEESPDVIAHLGDMTVRAMRAIDGRFMSVDIIRTPSPDHSC